MAIIDHEMLWRQFGAAIDMLGDALRNCPDEYWEARLWEDQPDQWVAKGVQAFVQLLHRRTLHGAGGVQQQYNRAARFGVIGKFNLIEQVWVHQVILFVTLKKQANDERTTRLSWENFTTQ